MWVYYLCWRMCSMEDHLYNPPLLSLLCSQWLRAQAPRVPTPDPSFLVGCANETEPSVLTHCRLPRNTLHLFSSFTSIFADLSIYGLGSKVARFTAPCRSWIREALSRHLCFLHLLAGFAVRLTTTHPFESIK